MLRISVCLLVQKFNARRSWGDNTHVVEVRNLDEYGLALDINKVGMDCKTKQLSAPLALTYDPSK